MEIFSTVKLAATIGSTLVGMSSGGSDPSRVAAFETYEAILAINHRIAGVENGLITIHDAVVDLSGQIGDALDVQTNQEAVERLEVSLSHQVTLYDAYLANVRDGSKPDEETLSAYHEELSRELNDFRRTLTDVINTAPFSLDVALSATAIEMHMHRRVNNSANNPKVWAQSRIAGIRSMVSGELADRIAAAEARMLEDRVATGLLVAIEDWATSTEALVPAGSFYTNWGHYGSFLCLTFLPEEIYRQDSIRLLNIAGTAPSSVIITQFPVREGARVCGSQVIGSSSVFDLKIGDADLPFFSPSGNQLNNALNRIEPAYRDALLSLERANLSAARFAVLSQYRDDIVAAVDAFEISLLQMASVDSAALERAFAQELSDLSRYSDRNLIAAFKGMEAQLREIEKVRFANQMTEAALAADRRIGASIARYQAVVRSYEDNRRGREIASALKRIVMGAEIMNAVIEFSEVVPVETAKEMVVELAEPQPEASGTGPPHETAAQTATPLGLVRGPSTTSAPPAFEARWQKARRLIDEISELGIPRGDPRVMPLQPQERLAEELGQVLLEWGPTEADKMYDDYMDSRDEAAGDVVTSLLTGDVGSAARLILVEALAPSMTGDSTLDSIKERNSLQREAAPLLATIRDWRTGVLR